MNSLNSDGESYFEYMEFNKYNFSSEEKRRICEFYEYIRNGQSEYSFIQPITKENLTAIEYQKEFVPDVCMLWQDDNSNYAGVYYKGSLRGKVMFLTHDEPNYAPLFQSIQSLIKNIKSGIIEDFFIPPLGTCDYPSKHSTEEEKESNAILAKEYIEKLRGDDEDRDYQLALIACYLMPAEYLELLIPLMNSGNMYIEQDIPEFFVFHDYKPAIPILQDICESGSTFAKDSSKHALLKLRSNVN